MKNSVRFSNTIFLTVSFAVALIYLMIIDNTYDTGDSLEHYEISKYSWKHTFLFFDNWGKPVFTFLSSPFTQLGWIGMKLFNSLVGVSIAYMLAKIIQKVAPDLSPYWALMLFCIPNWVLSMNSGLTEPLYAFFVVAAFCCIVYDRPYVAAILISFLPMVRNEGYITMTVYACYFALTRQWKALGLLSIGTILVLVLGLIFLKNNTDPLWLFHTNPYTKKFEEYGHGDWDSYFVSYYYMVGIPFVILTVCSIAYIFYTKMKIEFIFKAPDKILWLCLGVFLSFFFAHVIFWRFGLFNSFGMSRVLLSVIPLIIVLIAMFLEALQQYMQPKAYRVMLIVIAIVVVIFPYSGNKSGFILPQNFNQGSDMIMAKRVVDSLKGHHIQYDHILVSSPAMIWNMNLDQFETNAGPMANLKLYPELDLSNTILIYDNWYSELHNGVTQKMIEDRIGKDKLIIEDTSEDGSVVKVYYVPPRAR